MVHMYISMFSREIILGMLNMYGHSVRTCMHTYIHHIHTNIRIHQMHHKFLASSNLGTSMICTKHRFSIIYEWIHVFPTNSGMLGLHRETTAYIRTYMRSVLAGISL